MNRLILPVIIILLSLPSSAFSKVETIHATYKYIMGDNDTKNDAKRLCFIGAKRRLLEKIGTFIVSRSEIQNFKLTKDEIISYSAAFVNAEVEDERVVAAGETFEVVMTLRADIDVADVKQTINRIIEDGTLKQRVQVQNRKIIELENKIKVYRDQLTVTNYDGSFQLRKERKEALQALDTENEAIRKILLSKKRRDTKRARKIAVKSKQIRQILTYGEIGMTPSEIEALIREVTGKKIVLEKQPRPPIYKKNKWKVDLYSWDKMEFYFRYDEYAEAFQLWGVHFSFVDVMGKPDSILLKHGKLNILDIDTIKQNPEHQDYLERLKRVGETLCLYVWGKDCPF